VSTGPHHFSPMLLFWRLRVLAELAQLAFRLATGWRIVVAVH
jgi:hypothetical protein